MGELTRRVTGERTIALGGGRATVFSTPAMIDLMEHAARACVATYLDESEETVGMDVNVTHLAATPIGATVRAVARITGINDRVIDFDIEAFDESAQIGRGTHRRAVINVDRFAQKLHQKGDAVSFMPVNDPQITPDTKPIPTFSTLSTLIDAGVMTLTLNRPDRLNAINPTMSGELRALVDWLAGHEELVRVVVVTGAGKGFCAGDDLKRMLEHSIDEAQRWNVSEAELFLAMQKLAQPLIAKINGACFGGGIVIALSCDLRIAASSARFGMPEVNMGWPPSFAIPLLSSAVGKPRAIELCLRGHTIDAREAAGIGLVHRIVPAMMLDRTVSGIAKELVSKPPLALRETRRLLHATLPDITPWTETRTNASYIRSLTHPDAKEGLAAFIEKRPPRFTGR
jgi:enoyl-CoA hydratase